MDGGISGDGNAAAGVNAGERRGAGGAPSTSAVPAYVKEAIYGGETDGKTKAERYNESINKYVRERP